MENEKVEPTSEPKPPDYSLFPENKPPSVKTYQYGPEDKLQIEVEKIKEEVKLMKKPYLQLTFWVGVVALTLSLGSNLAQWFILTDDEQTYKSKLIIAKAELTKAEDAKKEAEAAQKQAETATKDIIARGDQANTEYNKLQTDLAEIRKQVSTVKDSSNSETVRSSLGKVEQTVTNLETSTKNAKEAFNAAIQVTPLQIAITKEKEGFQDLINGDYLAASVAFQASENAYPSYHNVYELAKLLRENQSYMNDPIKKRQVFQTIINKYSYGAPPDQWKRVVQIASE
ncbi:MAG TPA: hypothetical protein VGO50_10070 [Pyrinomonadaceae bacterium]|jgi:hypothetical protein|nr:hypothetical protein [Pyrinomonadaceae bacterium]